MVLELDCARAIAVDTSRILRSCCLALGCDLLFLLWIASVWLVMMRAILIVGSPLAGLAGLALAMWRGRCSRCGEVGHRLRCCEDAVCVVDDLLLLRDFSIDDGRWILDFGGSYVYSVLSSVRGGLLLRVSPRNRGRFPSMQEVAYWGLRGSLTRYYNSTATRFR